MLPGQTTGNVLSDRISSVDVMPTILDLLDIQPSPDVRQQMRGASLAQAIRGAGEPRDVFSETDYRLYTYKRSIITPDGWKLIYTLENRSRELFDLNGDPRESSDLAAAEKKRADELEQRLFHHFKAIGHDLRAKRWDTGLNPVYPLQGKVRP